MLNRSKDGRLRTIQVVYFRTHEKLTPCGPAQRRSAPLRLTLERVDVATLVNASVDVVRQAADVLRRGGVIVYPTDSCYALGCHIGDKAAMQRISDIRQVDRNHHFTLVCRDLAEVGKYALVENWQYRLLRAFTPGPYTFLLKASNETPRRLKHERRGTIGLRVPDHPVTAMMLEELAEPVMSSTLMLPGDQWPLTDAKEIYESLERNVDMVLDGGNCGLTPTSVIDLSGERAIVVREGRGDVSPFAAATAV